MFSVLIRVYGDLNDFLPVTKRQVAFERRIRNPTSVKDLLEGAGIPHPEIAMILVDSTSVGFDVLIERPCRIAVYPRFSRLPLDPGIELQPRLASSPHFILDSHLGRLTRYLRLLGFDSRYNRTATDAILVRRARTEHRLLLTRDRRLLMRSAVVMGYYVRATDPRRQVEEVTLRLQLHEWFAPFTRCLACNGLIHAVEKVAVADQLEPQTRRFYERFWQCHECHRIYWQGSHYERLSQIVSDLTNDSLELPV